MDSRERVGFGPDPNIAVVTESKQTWVWVLESLIQILNSNNTMLNDKAELLYLSSIALSESHGRPELKSAERKFFLDQCDGSLSFLNISSLFALSCVYLCYNILNYIDASENEDAISVRLNRSQIDGKVLLGTIRCVNALGFRVSLLTGIDGSRLYSILKGFFSPNVISEAEEVVDGSISELLNIIETSGEC